MNEIKNQKIDILRKKSLKPKYHLSLSGLNTVPKLTLINEFGISPLLANLIVEKKPFDDIDEILKFDHKNLSYKNYASLFNILKTSNSFQNMIPAEGMIEVATDGYTYGSFNSKNNSIWIFINLPNINLIAAKLNTISESARNDLNDQKKIINYRSIHFFGTHFMIMRHDLKTRKILTELLHSPIVKKAARLYEKEIPEKFNKSIAIGLKELSKILRFTQELTKPRFNPILTIDEFKSKRKKAYTKLGLKADKIPKFKSKPTKQMVFFSPKNKQECETNGCSYSPDGNWKSCCDTHDICYCKGGTEADRLKCDNDFRDCMEEKAGWILAFIYYKAVRNFGASHFNYFSGGGEQVFESSPIQSNDCLVTFNLRTIKYNGDNIGNDVIVELIVDVFCEGEYIGEGTFYRNYDASEKFECEETKRIYDTIFSKVVHNARNKKFKFVVTVSAKEKDAGPDDYQSFEYEHKNIYCGHIYEGYTEVYVSEWCEGTAEFRFDYDMNLTCVSV